MIRYWLSTTKMTVTVETDATGIIRTSPPIVRRFVGQPLTNLVAWLGRQPGFQYRRLD